MSYMEKIFNKVLHGLNLVFKIILRVDNSI